jgi:hypothetical protein
MNSSMSPDSERVSDPDASPQYAPAQFFRFSILLAICFGSALLSQILPAVLK